MNKYRVLPWGSIISNERMYGVQVKVPGARRYQHCCEGSTPLIYKTQAEALAKIRQLSQKELENNQ